MTLDDERLSMIRANAALAVEQFRDLSGAAFGFDAGSVVWVEGFIERMRTQTGEDGVADGVVAVIGSYLGEAIIAGAGSGQWNEDDAGNIGVAFANGDAVYPFAKVRKQFDQGLAEGESIASFYNVSVTFIATGKLHGQAGREGGAP